MKPRLTKTLSVLLAGVLQLAPMLRTALPVVTSTSSMAMILRWVAGGIALMGFDAKSGASGLSTPSSATIGVPYYGTINYSGGHSGQVSSMNFVNSNTCLGTVTIAPGLTLTYSGGYTAVISGTPTGSLATVPITLKMYDASTCGSGQTDTRSTSLIIQNTNGAAAVPSFTVAPQNITAQVGSDVILGGAASGNPTPGYFWRQGLSNIFGATNNNFTIPAAQLTNAGIYSLYATNSQGTASAACYLSMVLTPGGSGYLYTNYIVAGTTVTMNSYITNVPTATNTYQWQYVHVNISGATSSNLSFVTSPAKSGIYTINFNSVVGTNILVNNQAYDTYWQFGYLPAITNQPSPVTVPSGSNATFNLTLSGSSFATLFLYQNATNLVATQSSLAAAYNPSTISATTNLSFTLTNVTPANAGNYTVVITNSWGSITSSVAALTVNSSLTVSAPAGVTNYAGKNVSLSVTPSGTGPFGYQWQKSAVNLSNGGAISGVNTSNLAFTPAAVGNSGLYQVVVSNTSGSVTSSVAAVSILPLPAFGLSVVSNQVALSASGGVAGSNYIVQYSTNLLNTNGWLPLKTNVVPGTGIISFTDTNSATAGQRFYRLQFP